MSDLVRSIIAAGVAAGVFALLFIAARVIANAARPDVREEEFPLDRPRIVTVPGTPQRVVRQESGVVVQYAADGKRSMVVIEPSPEKRPAEVVSLAPSPMELAVASMLLNDDTKPSATISEPTPLEALEVRSVEPFESSPSMAEHASSFDHGSSFDSSSGGFDGGGSSGGFDP